MPGSSDTLSVMQVILTLERAGAQQVVRTLAEQLVANGCTVTICAFQDGPMRAEIEKLGVQVAVLDRPRYGVALLPLFLLELIRIRRQLVRLVRTYHVEVIQTHILQMLDFLVLTLRYDTSVRLVLWTMQNIEFLPHKAQKPDHRLHQVKRLGYRLLYRLLASQGDGFIAVSDQVRESIISQVGPVQNKIFTICNAVDPEPFGQTGDRSALCKQLGIRPDSYLVATVGRLTEQKGHRYLIDAARSVTMEHPEVHFMLIGDGELRGKLERQARETGVWSNIHFMGVRENVPELLATADLFVLPSLWEGLSVALLEAMAAGKAVIATTVSGNLQVLSDGKTGLLVPARDSRALARAIAQLVSAPDKAQALADAAREYVGNHYSARKQAQEHLALYRELLSLHSRR